MIVVILVIPLVFEYTAFGREPTKFYIRPSYIMKSRHFEQSWDQCFDQHYVAKKGLLLPGLKNATGGSNVAHPIVAESNQLLDSFKLHPAFFYLPITLAVTT